MNALYVTLDLVAGVTVVPWLAVWLGSQLGKRRARAMRGGVGGKHLLGTQLSKTTTTVT